MTARDHNRLLSIFYFIMAGLQLIGGIAMALIYTIMGGAVLSTSGRQDEQIMGGVFVGIGVVVGGIMLALGGLTLLTAVKVMKEKPIGRTLGIIVSILVLLSFPIGTALGVYGLWFFFGEAGKNYYSGLSGGSYSPP